MIRRGLDIHTKQHDTKQAQYQVVGMKKNQYFTK